MQDIGGIPYTTAKFDRHGKLVGKPTVPQNVTDVLVVSHGWNNDEKAAELLYKRLFTNFARLIKGDPEFAQRRPAIVGVIWPAKKFQPLSFDSENASKSAGGAASIGGSKLTAAKKTAMRKAIGDLSVLFDGKSEAKNLDRLKLLIDDVEKSAAARSEFVESLRKLMKSTAATTPPKDDDEGEALFEGGTREVLFSNLGRPSGDIDSKLATKLHGTARVGTAGLGDGMSSISRSISSLLNLTTYFEMKKRAGTIGAKGLAPLLDSLAKKAVRIHLVGHSFGARLVTAAAMASSTDCIRSLSLLQAAFSHNAFSAKQRGFFRDVLARNRVNGPILVTHTQNDTAVGLHYAIASRLSQDSTSKVGGPGDKFGGLGANGAQQMASGEVSGKVTRLLAASKPFSLQARQIHNLEASDFIVVPGGGDAHGQVHGAEVAWAISRAIASS